MTTNYREILRLESLGLNKTDIASAAQCARNTVSTTLARASLFTILSIDIAESLRGIGSNDWLKLRRSDRRFYDYLRFF